MQDLGAGRIKKEDKIDLSVGIKLNKTVNNKVKKENYWELFIIIKKYLIWKKDL